MHPEMVCMMEKFVRKFKGVHLNKLLNIQGKGFKDLPIMNEHMDKKNEKCILCYQKALGYPPLATAISAIYRAPNTPRFCCQIMRGHQARQVSEEN